MSEERLQEIKDSIDLQEKIMTKNMLVDEEKELYDEVARLTNIINKLEKYICGMEYDTRLVDSIWRPVALIHNKLKELKGDSSNDK